jgi:hypothetical protein
MQRNSSQHFVPASGKEIQHGQTVRLVFRFAQRVLVDDNHRIRPQCDATSSRNSCLGLGDGEANRHFTWRFTFARALIYVYGHNRESQPQRCENFTTPWRR